MDGHGRKETPWTSILSHHDFGPTTKVNTERNAGAREREPPALAAVKQSDSATPPASPSPPCQRTGAAEEMKSWLQVNVPQAGSQAHGSLHPRQPGAPCAVKRERASPAGQAEGGEAREAHGGGAGPSVGHVRFGEFEASHREPAKRFRHARKNSPFQPFEASPSGRPAGVVEQLSGQEAGKQGKGVSLERMAETQQGAASSSRSAAPPPAAPAHAPVLGTVVSAATHSQAALQLILGQAIQSGEPLIVSPKVAGNPTSMLATQMVPQMVISPMPLDKVVSQMQSQGRQQGVPAKAESSGSGRGDREGPGCKCKNSQCLKRYCPCFAATKYCGEKCKCVRCLNTNKHEALVVRARAQVERKKPGAFVPKVRVAPALNAYRILSAQNQSYSSTLMEVPVLQHQKGCRCVRTKCLKRYCECFAAKVPCGTKCTCSFCENNEAYWQQRSFEAQQKSLPR